MKQFRSVVFWAHLVTGLVAGAIVLLMSVTGVLLTYQRQITAWADTRGLDGASPVVGAKPLAAEALLERVRQVTPGAPTAIRWRADANAPVEVVYGRARTVFVNGYTGEVLSEGSEEVRAFFRTMIAWHRWLGVEAQNRAAARAMTGASNLGFLFLVVSGAYLWWPRKWTMRAVRNVSLFRRGLTGKARDFNWHNVLGLWMALPLIAVVGSAVVISYPWASDLVYRAVGEEPPSGGRGRRGGAGDAMPGPSQLAGADRLKSLAEKRMPGWQTVTLQLPAADDDTVTFSLDSGDGGQPQKHAQLTFDRTTGEVLRWEPFSSNSAGRRLRGILRFAHTGEIAGLLGQTIAGMASLASALLVWTGFSLSLRRLVSWRSRRRDGRARGAHPSRSVDRA